jgi:DNA-binding transcriptional LysR family regulator
VPKVPIETFSVHLRANIVADGPSVTVLPRSILQLHADRFAIKALPIKLPKHEFPVAIVTLKSRMPNPVVQAFIEHVRAGVKLMGVKQPGRH